MTSPYTKFDNSSINVCNDIISGPGGKQILAEDPSGNPIEVFQAV
jgi:hypothetical protein